MLVADPEKTPAITCPCGATLGLCVAANRLRVGDVILGRVTMMECGRCGRVRGWYPSTVKQPGRGQFVRE